MTGADDDTVPVCDAFLKIPAADGRVLSARMWRPTGEGRWPVILEFSPYRVWDLFRGFGEAIFPYWAAHGYVVIAVDIAGSGASRDLLHDEYIPSEFDDACAAIDWCAVQGWCDGKVGLSGFSWAAFTALRVSDRRPKALKAMVLGGVSDDGWRTDIHALGGAAYTAQVDWAGVMLMFNSLPPDPSQSDLHPSGEDWRAQWKARLEANKPWIVRWLTHPAHDTYWTDKASTFAGDVPLLLYAGLADKYATSVLHIAEHWHGPVRTILGPWEHAPPHVASRGPRIGFLQEALRWWDRWLKDCETGVMHEPPLRLWVGAPDKTGAVEDGYWRALEWPLHSATPIELWAANGALTTEDTAPGWQTLAGTPRATATLSADLYEDVPAPFDSNGAAFVATGGIQNAPVDIVGTPVLRCRVRGGGGHIIARLCDIAPDGTAIRMTTGARDLSQAGPGEDGIVISFQACAWRLLPGHRVQLVLDSDGTPTLWPEAAALAVEHVRLSLSVLPAATQDEVSFAPPVVPPNPAPPQKLRWIDRTRETIAFAPRDGAAAHTAASAAYHLPATGTDYFIAARFEVLGAWAAKSYRVAFERPGFSIRIDARLEVSSTPDAFHVAWTLRAADDGRTVHNVQDSAVVARS